MKCSSTKTRAVFVSVVHRSGKHFNVCIEDPPEILTATCKISCIFGNKSRTHRRARLRLTCDINAHSSITSRILSAQASPISKGQNNPGLHGGGHAEVRRIELRPETAAKASGARSFGMEASVFLSCDFCHNKRGHDQASH